MEDDSEVSEVSTLIEFKPSYVLIAIDTHENMFIKNEDGEIPFQLALKACYDVADSLLLVQNRRNWCQFAIVLADEDDKANLLDFQSNILESIKFLDEKKDLSSEKLKDMYMRKGPLDLAGFLLFCKKKFTSINSAFYQRTIVYITNDDDPVSGDAQKRFTGINEAKSFQSNNITFQIITTSHEFKYEVFYNELFSVLNDELVEELAEDEEGLFNKLSSVIVTQYSQTRLKFYPIKGDDTRYLPIIKKDLIKQQKVFNNARVTTDGKLVKRLVRAGGTPSDNFTLKRHNDIVFTREEANKVKNFEIPTGLSLIHVSKRLTDIGYVRKKSTLIEFDDKFKENTDECRKLFSQFWQYCYEKERVLVCARKLKHLGKVRFVELIPKFAFKRKFFLVKNIPFQDEQRPLPPVEIREISYSTDQITVVEKMIEKLTFDYDPKMLPDPTFAKKRAYIKAKLLNQPMEEVYDQTLDTENMDKVIEEVAREFKDLFGLNVETITRKRKTTAAGSRAKRAK